MGRKVKNKNLNEQKAKIVKSCSKTNGDKMQDHIEAQWKREKKLHPLFIDIKTTIYVTKDKCNKEYAESYRNNLKQRHNVTGQIIMNK